MSAPLPDFRRFGVLTAAALNALAARVRVLAARLPGGGGAMVRPCVVIPGRHYAFELAERAGVLYCRQGWIDQGTGGLLAVGDNEWNELGAVAPCTVWLEIGGAPGACSAAVVLGPYDDTTPECSLRRRLGYVREGVPVDGVPVYHCVQVLGGVISPCAPRRTIGTPTPNQPENYAAHDYSWNFCHAGAILGSGYEAGGRSFSGRRAVLGFSCTIQTLYVAPECGGNTMTLYMNFNCAI